MNKTLIEFKLKTDKGFILVEVMLAIFIISVALLPISGMFIQAMQADVMANHYTEASSLAQKQLELLKTHSPEYWSDLTLPATLTWHDQTQLPSSRYTLTTNACLSATDNHVVEVTVMASWQERSTQCYVRFVTLYSAL